MPTDHNIRQLVINKMTDAQYEQAVKSADELYLTPDTGGGGDSLPDQTGNSGKFLTTNGSTASWANVPAGTVTSVRVQAGTGLSSSQSTAQNSTLNTTISIASGYKLPTTTEWSNKQDALPSQSGNSGKFLTTNGSTMSWATVQGGGGDSLPDQTGQEGKFLSTNGSTASWLNVEDSLNLEEIDINNIVPEQTGNSGKFLTTNGSTVAWATVQGGGSGYVPMPTVTTLTNTTYTLSVAENTIYEFTNAITSLTISSVVKSYLESFIYFTTGSSITFVDNSTLKWGGGSIPSLETNTTYCIAIKNGLAEIDKFGR